MTIYELVRKTAWHTAALSLALLCLSGQPTSATLLGKTVQIYDRTGGFGPPTESLLGTHVVGSQVEYDATFDFIDIGDTTITLGNNDRHCSGGFCPIQFQSLGDFFGFRIVDALDQIAPIIDVSLVSSTIAGFGIGDVTFSENDIFIAFEHLGVYSWGNVIPSGQAVLQITFGGGQTVSGTQIGEPATAFVLGSAIAGLCAFRRRRARVT